MMVERLNEMEPDENMDDAANAVFRDVLGHQSGYARGLGHLVIPDPSPSLLKNREFQRINEENEKNKAEAQGLKTELDAFKRDMAAMRAHFLDVEKDLIFRMTELESQSQSRNEIELGDA
ncbi:uncharacterized protein LOC118348581 [Juglans regia]|uniref:Uncharacterized protein LOC118348581 n=1 Tax=Juglans regia TaxID=51240 RepID=A0A6P9EGK8_JUGRE|nr:uncharacterized protein LOC118348581 [Juglans regia]